MHSDVIAGADGAAVIGARPDHAPFDRLARQTLGGIVWTGVALIAGFCVKVLLTRKMLPREMGLILAGQSLVSLVAAVASLGLPDAVVRFVASRATTDVAPRITVIRGLRVAAVATSVAALIALAAVATGANGALPADAVWSTGILVLALPLLALGDIFGAAFRGVNRLGTKLVLVDVGRPALFALGLLLMPLALTRQAAYVAALYVAAAAATLAVLWAMFRRDDTTWGDGGGATAAELLRFGVPLAGAALLTGPLVNNILPLMLSASAGPAPVAFYGVALSLQALVYIPVGILEQAVVPTWTRLASHGRFDALAESFRRWAAMSFAGSAAVGILLIANDEYILSLLFGRTFETASGVLRAAVGATVWSALIGPSEGMLRATGRSTPIFNARLAGAASAVGSGMLLIPAYGLNGAAAAFVIATVVINTGYGLALFLGERIHPVTRQYVLAAIIAGVGLAGAAVDHRYPLTGGIAAHAASAAILLINPDVRRYVRRLRPW